ncbi:MAG: Phosphoribosylformylglycinamidine synthase, synthetase subunit (EC [uncultured Campylobacterales bacterium]|uniref:Phosphoribosylformylglycinamidine synthase subunit PurL n=1 Tax=uncultured Campylobacterales bacterium TaxID=352960 RepID=A0A6S6SGM6_9BACT|nr:MAG: Phosphoribosylformylglycinamidine synthase, synthetase subunit (EC [uncultured Campylobacterales bacterium]
MENLKEILDKNKLDADDYSHIKEIMKREPNELELVIFGAMWSEHCSYKSSKKYLNGFPVSAPWVIQGPGENAGVIDIGDGYAAVFKMESHNHPSFIEPYQGAATGVGGILRDVFTMGARPVANMNSLRFGNINRDDKIGKYQRHLVRGVVAGIGDYGNCMGVPTIGGETSFDDAYNGNILVNAFTLGVCKSDDIFLGIAEGIGNPVIYVGSKTGRDGLGGAVMASDSFSEENNSLRPTVQVGDPFAEKLLLEACLELFKTDYIVGIQDMGAAGLTSSSFEMASRSGSGMKMHLDSVPAREENMKPFEFMLSESQERMLICAKKGYEDKVLAIFHKYDLDAEIIGEVTDTGNMELLWNNELIADIPVDPIAEEAPILDRPIAEPKYLEKTRVFDIDSLKRVSNKEAFETLIKSVEVVDKAWIYEQYDSMVQTNTIKGPGSLDGSSIRVKENGVGLSMSSDCNPRYCFIDPKGGAAAAVIESARNVAMSGAVPKAITDCLNFGSPKNPEVMWQFKESCSGIKEACLKLDTPVVSGNVSFYNETEGENVYPTPAIVMVGVNKDATKTLPSYFQKDGSSLYLLGETKSEFGGSLYLKEIYNEVAGVLPKIDYDAELKLWEVVRKANEKGIIKCAKDVNVGGIVTALYKMSVKSSKGVDVNIALDNDKDIFSESFARAIVEIENESLFEELCREIGIKYTKIGTTLKENSFKVNDINSDLDTLKNVYFDSFARVVEQDI